MNKEKSTAISSLLNELEIEMGITKKDFYLVESIQLPKGMNPNEWVLLKFKKVKGVSTPFTKKRVIEFFERKNIEIYNRPLKWKGLYKIYVKVFEIKPQLELRWDVLLKELGKDHLEAGILGVPNCDQRNLPEGFGNFNYINAEELKTAANLFSEAGIEFLERDEKPCNLSFLLDFDKIKKIKKIKRTLLGDDAITAFLWILKKVYRKKIITNPANINNGLSTRGIVLASKKQMEEICYKIKKHFGICIILQSESPSQTGFFILTNLKAIKIYEEANGLISVKKIVEQQKEKNKIKTKKMGDNKLKNPMVQELKVVTKRNNVPFRGEKDYAKGKICAEAKKERKDGEYLFFICNCHSDEENIIMETIFREISEIKNVTTTQRGKHSILVSFLKEDSAVSNLPEQTIEIEKTEEIQPIVSITEKVTSDKRKYNRKNSQHIQTEELLINNNPEEELRNMLNDPDLEGSPILIKIQKYFEEKDKEARKEEKIKRATELLALLNK